MVTEPLTEPRILLEQDMTSPLALPFAGGEVTVFSARSPAKSTPNEDAVALIPCGARRGVIAVADGVGGQATGGTAARHALETLAQVLTAGAGADRPLRDAILDGIEQANARITAAGTGTATTLAVAELDGPTVRSYHVGDSALVLVGQRGRLKLQTVSHSPVGYAVEAGFLDEDEALSHADRHLVSNILGAADMHIAIGPNLPVAPRDTLLLGSDGLFDNMLLTEIVDVIRKGPVARVAEALCERCRRRMQAPLPDEPSKPDDLTFAVWRPRPEAR